MVITTIKRLAAARGKIAKLEAAVESELPKVLSKLHEQFGFENVELFLAAVESAASKKKGKVGRPKKMVVVEKVRRRAKITDATRAKVMKLVKAGLSGSKIAKAAKISLPSVQNIKKALGLVKSRKEKAKKTPAKKVVAKKRSVKKKRVVKAPVAAPEAPPPTAA